MTTYYKITQDKTVNITEQYFLHHAIYTLQSQHHKCSLDGIKSQYQWTCAVESCVAHDPARVGLEGM